MMDNSGSNWDAGQHPKSPSTWPIVLGVLVAVVVVLAAIGVFAWQMGWLSDFGLFSRWSAPEVIELNPAVTSDDTLPPLQYEWSYDRFHEKGDSLYRISVRWTWEGREDESFQFLAPVGPALKSDYHQVKEFLRVRGPFDEYFYHQNRPVRLDPILHVDSTFFDLLSFELLQEMTENQKFSKCYFVFSTTPDFYYHISNNVFPEAVPDT